MSTSPVHPTDTETDIDNLDPVTTYRFPQLQAMFDEAVARVEAEQHRAKLHLVAAPTKCASVHAVGLTPQD